MSTWRSGEGRLRGAGEGEAAPPGGIERVLQLAVESLVALGHLLEDLLGGAGVIAAAEEDLGPGERLDADAGLLREVEIAHPAWRDQL